MNGLIGAGQYYRRSAQQLFGQAAQDEQRRNQVNQQIKAQDQQSTLGLVGAGAGVGTYLAAGTALGGPVGALVGAGVGLLASKLL